MINKAVAIKPRIFTSMKNLLLCFFFLILSYLFLTLDTNVTLKNDFSGLFGQETIGVFHLLS